MILVSATFFCCSGIFVSVSGSGTVLSHFSHLIETPIITRYVSSKKALPNWYDNDTGICSIFFAVVCKKQGLRFRNCCISFRVRHSCVSFQATLLRHILLLSMCCLKSSIKNGIKMILVSAAFFCCCQLRKNKGWQFGNLYWFQGQAWLCLISTL